MHNFTLFSKLDAVIKKIWKLFRHHHCMGQLSTLTLTLFSSSFDFHGPYITTCVSPLNDLYLWSCKYTSKKIISRTNEISIERKTTFHFFSSHSFLLHQLVTMNYWFFFIDFCSKVRHYDDVGKPINFILSWAFYINYSFIYIFLLLFFGNYMWTICIFFWIRKEITCFIKNYLRSHTIDMHNDRQ